MTLLQKLTDWQQRQAIKENVKTYMVLPFKTLQEIARVLPKTEMDLLLIKGVGPVKIRKYGKTILNILQGKDETTQFQSNFSHSKPIFKNNSNFKNEFTETMSDVFVESELVNEILESRENLAVESRVENIFHSSQKTESQNKVDLNTGEILEKNEEILSVSQALDICNASLMQNRLRICGEVTKIDFRERVIYFSLKDKTDESVVSGLIFRNDYELSGVILKEGLEIVIEAVAEIYKPTGRLSLKASSIELVGEGVLKKAYLELRKKLENEGLFSTEKKREIVDLPQRIGLITSRDGAAIGDFLMNLGNYGYQIIFCHSSVEGQKAVKEILQALKIMRKQNLDVLVIVRGGGSLESLQAFNNEKIVREIANFPVPVVAGIGHEQDETLATLVADKGVSTPTASARIVRESWDLAKESFQYKQHYLIDFYSNLLEKTKNNLENNSEVLNNFFQKVKDNFTEKENNLGKHFKNLGEKIITIKNGVNFFEKSLWQNNPERQLKLGYAIVRNENGEILKSVKKVSKDAIIKTQLADGFVKSKVL